MNQYVENSKAETTLIRRIHVLFSAEDIEPTLSGTFQTENLSKYI